MRGPLNTTSGCLLMSILQEMDQKPSGPVINDSGCAQQAFFDLHAPALPVCAALFRRILPDFFQTPPCDPDHGRIYIFLHLTGILFQFCLDRFAERINSNLQLDTPLASFSTWYCLADL